MATAYEEIWSCNRCGAEDRVRLPSSERRNYDHPPVSWRTVSGTISNGEDIALCFSCAKQFEEWMKAARVERPDV